MLPESFDLPLHPAHNVCLAIQACFEFLYDATLLVDGKNRHLNIKNVLTSELHH